MEELNLNKDKNKYRCDICNNPNDYLLCEQCFRNYNSGFQENLNNFISTRKTLSKKIDDLLSFNIGKSEKLNKKIMLDKCKEVLESRIKQEEEKIKKYKEENNKYEISIINIKDNISGLKNILKDFEIDLDENKTDINNSSINLSNFIIECNNNNNQISNIKNEIFNINNKIRDFKKKYIINLFDELFIKKKAVIKISEFFTIKQYQGNKMNFSIIKTSNNYSYNENIDNENDTLIRKEIISKLNDNAILLKRFSSFFKTMIIFLEKAYKKFKIKMPFKINHFKIEYKNGFEYNFEINKTKLNDQSALNSVIKGYHLLNINYYYLMQNIFGDSIKFNDWFDISKFFEFLDKDYDMGSIHQILEEAKNDKNQEEFLGFVVIDE